MTLNGALIGSEAWSALPWMTFRCSGDALPFFCHVGHQERDHPWIDFDRRDACTFGEELVREDADTRSDLEHVVTAGERRTVSDLLEDAVVDQKMLAEIGIQSDAVKV